MSNVISLELEDLPQRTRDWLIARSSRDGISPRQLLERVADQQAKREGFLNRVSAPKRSARTTSKRKGAA